MAFPLTEHRPLIGIVSSRLGRPVERRREWFYLLDRVMQRAFAEKAILLVAPKTTCEPWVSRAAELYGLDSVAFNVAEGDAAIVKSADVLFALRVRKNGNIYRLLMDHLSGSEVPVYVGINGDKEDASKDLMQSGAIGWYCSSASGGWSDSSTRDSEEHCTTICKVTYSESVDPSLLGIGAANDIGGSSDFLVHCTRGSGGRRASQTENEWRDSVLLGSAGSKLLNAGEVLCEIIRSGYLKGAPLSRTTGPVVCFSACDLQSLLRQRTFRPHRCRWDYEPYGIAIRKEVLVRCGGMPVIYGDKAVAQHCDGKDQWRFQAVGQTYDWTREKEWRIRGSLQISGIRKEDALIFVPTPEWSSRVEPISPWPVIVAGESSWATGKIKTPHSPYAIERRYNGDVQFTKTPYLLEHHVEPGYRRRNAISAKALQVDRKRGIATSHRGGAAGHGRPVAPIGTPLSARRSDRSLRFAR